MPEEHCFVCASNEGIFLDVFADGRNYRDIIETCLSIKIQKKKMRSTKICHKCVYELDQCSKFVQRYKKTHRIEKGKVCKKRGCCCLCMEPGRKGYIFDLWDENRLDNSVEKLNELFDIDLVTDNLGSLSICLDCRYNLDVLVDLKNLFKDTSRFLQEILNGDMNLSELPKITTSVVKRQTTLTRTPKLSQSKSSLTESDTSTIVLDSPKRERALSSRKLSPHERKCDECNATIDNGMDMYRYHHTGNTVCKECWLTMDPCGKTKSRARKINNTTMKTKLCSVFLKDILTDALETEKNTTTCKVEKGTDGETIYIISSDETDDENEKKMLSTRLTRTKRKEPAVETKPKKKLKTQHTRRAKLTRSNSAQSINQINKRSTRQTRSESAETSDSEGKKLRKRSESIGKSVAPTSKPKREKKLKESQSRVNKSKKRKTTKSDSSSSSNEIILPSKVRRFSSPSYKIDSTDSKNESDSDNEPYVCKICSNDFENKVVGKTHELTHSKKLGVMLQKVEMPEQSEEDKILERTPSMEFNSPARSDGAVTEVATGFRSAINDESTSGQHSKIHDDLPDDDSQNRSPRATAKEHVENRDEKEQRKRKETVGTKNAKKDTAKNKKQGAEKSKKQGAEKNKKKGTAKVRDKENEKIEEKNDENIIVEEGDKENGVEEKEEVESNMGKEQDKIEESEKELSTSGSIQDNKSVHETNGKDIEDTDEQPAQTHEANPREEISELNEKESLEHIEIAQDKISTEKKNVDEIKNDIENVEENTSNSSEKDKNLLENNEKDSASPSAVVEKSNGELTEESNETNKVGETIENGNLVSENKTADESKEGDEKHEDGEEKTDEVSEEKNEDKPSEETLPNGNVRKLSDVEASVNDEDDDGVGESGEKECVKQSEKSEECSDPNVKDTGEKNNDIASDEKNNETRSDEIESRVACTEDDIKHTKSTEKESNEIENRLAEIMGENESKESEECNEKTSDEVKNIEPTPSSEPTAIEDNCES